MRVLRSKGSHDNAANAPRPIADGSQEREARRDSPKSDPRALVQSTKLTPSITAPGNVPNPRSGCQPNHLRLTIFDCRLALSKLANWQCPALSAAPRANNHNGFVILGLRPQVRVGKMNQARESGRQHGYGTGAVATGCESFTRRESATVFYLG